MKIEDISTLDFGDRVALKRGKAFYNFSVEERVSLDDFNREQVTEEMLDEIHLMLRTILTAKGWKFNGTDVS